MDRLNARMNGMRVAALVALGLEFARSHGVEYARSLIEEMGADEATVRLFVTQAERSISG